MKWFQIKALGTSADIYLRGDIGVEKPWSVPIGDGEEMTYDTGGAGTLSEFESELQALGNIDTINLYISSDGGDVQTGIAIHNILARHKARIVCTIDGWAFSIATVIAMAADEIRIASNGLMMIHDAEIWLDGGDIEDLQNGIQTLNACNSAIVAAYRAKAGGTEEEWMSRMTATTWLTGVQAKEIGLVDTVTDAVALSAFAPLSKVTNRLKVAPEIKALIDAASLVTTPPTQDDMTAEEIKALVDEAVATATGVIEAKNLETITALKADTDAKLTAHETEAANLKAEIAKVTALAAHGIPSATASGAPAVTARGGVEPVTMTRSEFSKLSAHEQSAFFAAKGNKVID